jgi:hypothetical protein
MLMSDLAQPLLGVAPPSHALFYVIGSPVGPYYKEV